MKTGKNESLHWPKAMKKKFDSDEKNQEKLEISR